ncbi:MAG: ATP-binding cassette domain-containing protein, partial [Candidatus Latescibacteria bacterium]|nr:ATP-binding cassette domain-containing protein [Candidatus Latescibacterota bacterium]
MISADQLTKVYEDDVMGLDHLTLEVKPGEIFCMLGANGAGKTTTINLFLNFIEPSSGTAFINGIDAVKNPLEAKKHVAYLGEVVQLYGNFTAMQNLDFFTKLGGKADVSKKEYRDC